MILIDSHALMQMDQECTTESLNTYTNSSEYTNIHKTIMATFTVSIPQRLKDALGDFPEINVAEYLKKRFDARIEELRRFEALKNKGAI